MAPKKKFQWSRGEDGGEGEAHFTERASRKKSARMNDRIFRLGKALVELEPSRLDGLALSEEVRDAVDQARRLKARRGVRSAMRRQLLFVAGVLRDEDGEVIEGLCRAIGL